MSILVNNRPLISVIIPTYNHAHFIGRCLRSVINQTYTNWEAIVVNNFSKDNTVDVVNSFSDPRIRLINFNNHGVIAASRNKGIRVALGKYVAFLDSDDWWYDNKLEVCSRFFGEADVIYHNLQVYVEGRKALIKKIKGRQVKSPVFTDLMSNGNAIANSSVIMKKDVIEQVGFLDENPSLKAIEDFDLWIKASRVTERFRFIPMSLGAYWIGNNTTEFSKVGISRQNALYRKYIKLLDDRTKRQARLFRVYIIGRIKQKMGLYSDAIKLFRISVNIDNYGFKLKSVLFSIVCYIKKFLG